MISPFYLINLLSHFVITMIIISFINFLLFFSAIFFNGKCVRNSFDVQIFDLPNLFYFTVFFITNIFRYISTIFNLDRAG